MNIVFLLGGQLFSCGCGLEAGRMHDRINNKKSITRKACTGELYGRTSTTSNSGVITNGCRHPGPESFLYEGPRILPAGGRGCCGQIIRQSPCAPLSPALLRLGSVWCGPIPHARWMSIGCDRNRPELSLVYADVIHE